MVLLIAPEPQRIWLSRAAFDFKRTNTYIGCIAFQIWIAASAIIVFVISMARHGGEWTPAVWLSTSDDNSSSKITDYGSEFFLFMFPAALGMLCSLCLSSIAIWLGWSYRRYIPPKRVWRYNSKDLLMGTIDPEGTLPALSAIGNPRTPPVSAKREMYAPGNRMRRLFTNLLLRRVTPVEARPYALARNLFALASMAAILFRAVTALRKAHNQLGTRMVADFCEADQVISWSAERLDLLVAHNRRGSVGYPRTTITMNFNGTTVNCKVHGNQTDYTSRVFGCGDTSDVIFSSFIPSDATFYIEVRSIDDSSLSELDMSDIWIFQRPKDEVPGQTIPPDNLNGVPGPVAGRAASAYVPPWSLRPGFHIEAEAQKVIRRFIQSSFIEELVFNSDPVYKREILFPIADSGTSPFPNNTMATATIRPTLRPGYAFLRDSRAYHDMSKSEAGTYERNMCTFIDDFREGSILDVLGSIGGLYALLQSVHMTLFGRSMLWGLTGAKVIAPFGLLGMCGSRGFKRRLRDQYHRQPTDDNPGTFLMGAFLRDFVVELGPANVNLDVKMISLANQVPPTNQSNQREKGIDIQGSTPMKLEICQTPSLDVMIDIGELSPHTRIQVEDDA